MEDSLVKRIPQEEWRKTWEKDVFRSIFGNEQKLPEESYDFAVVSLDDTGFLRHAYTVKAASKDIAYICYGGALPDFRGKKSSFPVMNSIIQDLSKDFKELRFSCKNDNIAMLKFGIQGGFKIFALESCDDGSVSLDWKKRS